MPSNRLEILLSGNVKDFNNKMKSVDKQVDETMGEIKRKGQEAAVALGALAVAGGATVKSLVSEAVQMQKYEQTLKAITGSTAAARAELEKYTQFAATTPFDLKGVVEGATKMKALKVDVEKFLPLAGDLAAVFDRSLPDAALALAKAASGSQDGLTQLADSFGIAKKELIKFGAATKGDAIDVTQIDKLQLALQKVISSKYGGTMKAQASEAAGAFSNLEDAFSRLKAALGAELADDLADIAKSLTSLVSEITALPGPTKRMIAQAVLMGTVVAGVGFAAATASVALTTLAGGLTTIAGLFTTSAGASTLAAGSMGTMTLAATGLTGSLGTSAAAMATTEAAAIGLAGGAGTATVATTGFAGAVGTAGTALLGALAPALVVVGGGLIYLTHEYGKLNVVMEKSLAIEERIAGFQRQHRDIIRDVAEAVKTHRGNLEGAADDLAQKFLEAGKTDKDVSEGIVALMDQKYAAHQAGDQKTVDEMTRRLTLMKQVREKMKGSHKEAATADKASAEQAKAAIDAQAAAVTNYEQKASAGYWASAKDQLAALDSVLGGMNKNSKEYQKLNLSRVKLARQVKDEEVKLAEDGRKEKLDQALHEVDKFKVYGNDRLADQKAVLQQILDEEQLTADERRKIELQLLQTIQQMEQKAAADKAQRDRDQAKAAADALKAAQASAALKQKALDTEMKVSDNQIESLARQMEKGKDVSAQIIDELNTRQKLTEQVLRQQASVERLGKTKQEQALITRRMDAEIQASRLDTEREVEQVTDRAFQQKKKALSEALNLQDKLNEAQLAADTDVTEADLVAAARKRLSIAEAQLRLDAESASHGASEEEKLRIKKQLEVDLYAIQQQSTRELAKGVEQLKQQNQELDKQKGQGATTGGVQSLDEAIGDINSQWAGRAGMWDTEDDKKNDKAGLTKAGTQLGVDPNAAPPSGGFTQDQINQLVSAIEKKKENIRIELVPPRGGSQDDMRAWAWSSQRS